ncbi:RrF2 family transcriptional regulator [Vineibacter terrae]|uniref:Rrf2 family transcriptional regulator n=1 Tax=Vineibacter terrae TaxID=2586908 RepID=A0A5C8PVH9_9HYPH|nr:Rrf2 family transcriptional regulator [Vineibacter terrae]TXL81870.1 Rrf2 family transcriptional regulator [Vineibacter terrae]HEX2889657.1 Rrf2 family transcriptional regulator [Vineibacter terrae]
MPRLSKKTMFAIEAVLDIAMNGGDAPVRSGDITRRQNIPKRYLEQVLQHLVREGVLAGKRGPRGGYMLGRERRRISLGDIIRVVRQLEVETEPQDETVGSALAHMVVWPTWNRLRDEMMARMDGITVEDMVRDARERGVQTEAAQRLEFHI